MVQRRETPNNEMLEWLLEQAPEPIFVLDKDGKFIFINEKTCEILTTTESSLLGSHFRQHTYESDFESINLNFQRLLINGSLDETGVKFKKANGKPVYLDLRASLVRPNMNTIFFARVSELRSMDVIKRISVEINSNKTLEEVLQSIVMQMASMDNVDHSTITLLTQDHAFWEIKASCYSNKTAGDNALGAMSKGQDNRIPINGIPVQEKIRDELRNYLITDLESHQMFKQSPVFAKIAKERGIKSIAVFPMIVKGRVIGTISADSIGKKRVFTIEDKSLFKTIANQAAIVIENARSYEFQKTINESFKLEDLAYKILLGLKKVVDFERAYFVELLEENRRIEVAEFPARSTSVGVKDFEVARFYLQRPVKEDDLVAEIVANKRPKVVPDTSREPKFRKVGGTFDVNSWVGLPLVYNGNTIAFITLDHSLHGHFSEDIEEELKRFADLAADNFHRAKMFQFSRSQIQSAESVSQFAEAINPKLELKDFINTLQTVIKDKLDCQYGNVFLQDDVENDDLLPQQISEVLMTWKDFIDMNDLNILQTLIERAFQTGKREIHEKQDFLKVPNSKEEIRITSVLIIVAPIKRGDQTLGVICAAEPGFGSFNEANCSTLDAIAAHAGNVLQRNIGINLLRNLGPKIIGTAKTDDILKLIVEGSKRLVHTDFCVVHLFDQKQIKVIDSFPKNDPKYTKPRLVNENGLTHNIIKERKFLIIPNDMHTMANPEVKEEYPSMIGVPLMAGDKVIGALFVGHKFKGAFSDIDGYLLQSLADQAAVVIEKNRIHHINQSLLDNMPLAMFQKDLDHRFVTANKRFCDHVRRSLEEIVDRTDFDFFTSEMAIKFQSDDDEIIRSGKERSWIEKNKTIDGEEMLVEVFKNPISNPEGPGSNPIGVQGIFWYIKDAQRVSEITETKRSLDRYNSLFENSPDGFLVVKNGQIVKANRAAEELIGKYPLIGMEAIKLVTNKFEGLAVKKFGLKPDWESKDGFREEIEIQTKSGTKEVEVYVTRYEEIIGKNNVKYRDDEMFVVLHDLTLIKNYWTEIPHRIKKGIEQLDRILLDQASNPNYGSVKSIITAMMGRIQAIKLAHEKLFPAKDGRPRLFINDHISKIIPSIWNAYGVDSTTIQPNLELCEVSLEFEKAMTCGLLVNEIVTNSILHAFGKSPGIVKIVLKSSGQYCHLIISDNGCGMYGEPRPDSLGLKLIDRFIENLKGTSTKETNDNGVSYQIQFPID